MGHPTCSEFATPRGMVLSFNKSLTYCKYIPTPSCVGPAPTFVCFCSEYSTPSVSLTLTEKTELCCPKCSCRKKFTSDNWQLEHIRLHHPEHLHVSNNLTVHSTPRRFESGGHPELNPNTDSVEDFDAFPYLEHIETIPDPEFQPPPAALS